MNSRTGDDIQGDLHVHTALTICEWHAGMLINEKDEVCGCASLEKVVEHARDIVGMKYLGVTNHSIFTTRRFALYKAW